MVGGQALLVRTFLEVIAVCGVDAAAAPGAFVSMDLDLGTGNNAGQLDSVKVLS
jgi:hypothetical protein